MLKMISAINDFEREICLERQHKSIAIAKTVGMYNGRKEISIPDYGGIFPHINCRHGRGRPIVGLSTRHGCSQKH